MRAATLLVVAAVFSGCIAIDTQTASQRLQGFVTLRLTVCVSDHDHDTYTTCQPGVNTAENDNGQDGDESGDGRGQLLVGFRVPDGTQAPTTFQSTDASLSLTKDAVYTAQLTRELRPAAGFHWEGYLSTEVPFDPARAADRTTTLAPEFKLPPGADGAPFAGPFAWRAMVGFRATRALDADVVSPTSAVDCDNFFHRCFDSPSANVATSIATAVSDIGIRRGAGATVAPGDTATVTFPIQNLRPAGAPLGNRTVTLSARTNVPGTSATTTGSSLVLVASPSTTPTQSTTVTVAIPPGTPAGTYTVTLTARAGSPPELVRANTGTITVVGPAAPAGQISPPSVAAPAPVVQPAPPPGRINVTLSFGFPSAAKSTKFTLLRINNVPAGSTVVATCKGKGCPTKRVKGKKRRVVLTKRNASGTVRLKPFLKKRLRAGTVITATVTKPGSFGMVKKLKVRAFKRPKLTTTCLQPGSATAKAPCSG